MAKKYNSRLIRDDYSYYVEQVAELFGIDEATVRRWMKDGGLERIPNTRPHLIHSSKLRPFIEKLGTARKKPCASHEMFCMRCQSPRTPAHATGAVTILANRSVRLKAACSVCGGAMCRAIRQSEWTKNHPLAVCLSDASEEHKGVEPLHRECSFQMEENHD